MCLFRKLFSKKGHSTESDSQEPWFNDTNNITGRSRFQTTDPLTGKKKKPMMDPVHCHIPGNGQDSNAVKKNGV